jgi:hypothetical protein
MRDEPVEILFHQQTGLKDSSRHQSFSTMAFDLRPAKLTAKGHKIVLNHVKSQKGFEV